MDVKSQFVFIISGNSSRLRLVRKAAQGKLEVVVRKWSAPDHASPRRRMPKLDVLDDAAVAEKLRSQFSGDSESPCF